MEGYGTIEKAWHGSIPLRRKFGNTIFKLLSKRLNKGLMKSSSTISGFPMPCPSSSPCLTPWRTESKPSPGFSWRLESGCCPTFFSSQPISLDMSAGISMIPLLGSSLKYLLPIWSVTLPCSIHRDSSMEYPVIGSPPPILMSSSICLSKRPRKGPAFHLFVFDHGCRPLEIMPSTEGSLKNGKLESRSMEWSDLDHRAGCSG